MTGKRVTSTHRPGAKASQGAHRGRAPPQEQGDAGGHADHDAKRQSDHGPKADSHRGSHVREGMFGASATATLAGLLLIGVPLPCLRSKGFGALLCHLPLLAGAPYRSCMGAALRSLLLAQRRDWNVAEGGV